MRLKILIWLSCITSVTYQWQENKPNTYKQYYNADEMYNRLVTLMQTIHREGRLRHETLNKIRFYYETTPHYELGYVMGEIIERYRKMVNHARRRHTWASTHLHWLIKRVQIIQHLYFEVFHLCGIMHEIENKYRTELEYSDIHHPVSVSDIADIQRKIKEERVYIEKQKQRNLKRMKKARKKRANADGSWPMYQKPKRQKGYWPIEYGWDIGSNW